MKASPEFLPVIEWWEKDGKQMVTYLAIAAVVVGAWYGWKNHRASKRAAASEALVSAYTAEELEDAVAKFSGTPTEGALKLRLAKNYFDAGRAQEALDVYASLEGRAPDGFADIPAVGKAQCLEALGKFDEAAAAFDAFVQANDKSYLKLTAQLGSARCVAQAGDKAKALASLAALKAAAGDDELAKVRIESTEDCVKRYEKRAEKSLFDAASTAEAAPAKAEEAPKAEAAAKVEDAAKAAVAEPAAAK